MALLPVAARALSCLPASHVADYLEVAADDAPWMIVSGRLSFDEGALPQVDWERQAETPQVTDIAARLTGRSLGRDGFTNRYARDITLRAECWGPWCAGAASGQDYLVFLKLEQDGPVAFARPCPGLLYSDPTAQMLGEIETCFSGGRCEAPPPFR